MKELDKDLENLLVQNYYWTGEHVIDKEKLKQIFALANYSSSQQLLNFMVYFYNYLFKFRKKEAVIDVDFRLKKVFKNYSHKYYYIQIKELLKVRDVTVFGMIDKGHMVLVADELDNIYAVMDDYFIDLGNNYFEMMNNFHKNGYTNKM